MENQMKMVVNSPQALAQAVSTIKAEFAKKKYLRLNITAGRNRSLEQNRLFHDWVQQLTIEHGEFGFDGYRDFCRLHFFVPILVHENEGFSNLWWSIFDKAKSKNRDPQQYQTQLMFVNQITGISSICTTAQFSRALEMMQKHFATLDNDPCFLEFPDQREGTK